MFFLQKLYMRSLSKSNKGVCNMSVQISFGPRTYHDARESFDDETADSDPLKECEAKNRQLATQIRILSGRGMQATPAHNAPYARRTSPAGPPTTAFASSQRR